MPNLYSLGGTLVSKERYDSFHKSKKSPLVKAKIVSIKVIHDNPVQKVIKKVIAKKKVSNK